MRPSGKLFAKCTEALIDCNPKSCDESQKARTVVDSAPRRFSYLVKKQPSSAPRKSVRFAECSFLQYSNNGMFLALNSVVNVLKSKLTSG